MFSFLKLPRWLSSVSCPLSMWWIFAWDKSSPGNGSQPLASGRSSGIRHNIRRHSQDETLNLCNWKFFYHFITDESDESRENDVVSVIAGHYLFCNWCFLCAFVFRSCAIHVVQYRSSYTCQLSPTLKTGIDTKHCKTNNLRWQSKYKDLLQEAAYYDQRV